MSVHHDPGATEQARLAMIRTATEALDAMQKITADAFNAADAFFGPKAVPSDEALEIILTNRVAFANLAVGILDELAAAAETAEDEEIFRAAGLACFGMTLHAAKAARQVRRNGEES